MASKKPQAAAAAQRVIKKYPNRRLYDTLTSTYITLAEVKQLVMKREEFEVVDAKTGEDLSRSILLQIILEEEASGSPMFNTDALANLIRFYGNAMQGAMGGYIEKGILSMMEIQSRMGEQTAKFSPEMWTQFMGTQNPVMQNMMGQNPEQSSALIAQFQEQMLKQFGVKR